jgi:quercetin dioxygenase-like cupin family protein
MIELSKLGEVFSDARGTIINICDGVTGTVSIIESKAGSRRSDHSHARDGHLLYVVSGYFDYYERPVGSTEKPAHRRINQGEAVWTGPGIEHATIFPVETVLLSTSLLPRNHEAHEADLIRLAEPLPIE